MQKSCFLGKVFAALGICMVMLSMSAFVDQANACGTCNGTGVGACATFFPAPIGAGCPVGVASCFGSTFCTWYSCACAADAFGVLCECT